MQLPLVSVVIPTFNYGHLVCEAVDSAIGQTYENLEVIVIDDGSTDDTRERLARYAGRIRYHYQANGGLSAARNVGIGLASGELIALLDSDDAFHPRKIDLQVRFLDEHPGYGLIATDCFSDEPRAWADLPGEIGDDAVQEVTLEDVVTKSRFSPSSVLVRRECFERAGLFDPELKSVEDRDMWIRIAAHYRMAVMSLPVTWYRMTPGSMSRNAEKMERFERLVLERAFAMPQVRRRWGLKRRASALASYAAAYRYFASGEAAKGRQRLLASFFQWPLPIRVPDVRVPFSRMRMLLRAVRGR